jgi:hypothetical protein
MSHYIGKEGNALYFRSHKPKSGVNDSQTSTNRFKTLNNGGWFVPFVFRASLFSPFILYMKLCPWPLQISVFSLHAPYHFNLSILNLSFGVVTWRKQEWQKLATLLNTTINTCSQSSYSRSTCQKETNLDSCHQQSYQGWNFIFLQSTTQVCRLVCIIF